MGLVDKIRNIFTEEVEDDEEVKVEQIKKEVRSVPIESPRMDRVPPTREDYKRSTEEVREDTYVEEKPKSPVFFTDRDFEDLVSPKRSREVVKPEKVEEPKKEEPAPKPYGGNYNTTTIIHQEKQIFKPTPIISPVYGVLDKNYHKEDIVDRKEQTTKNSIDGLSVDSIRKKAYGTLEDDLEDSMLASSPSKQTEDIQDDLFDELEREEEKEDVSAKITEQEKNIRELEEITMDLTKELDNLLLQKEKDKRKVTPRRIIPEEKEEDLSDSDLFNLIDSMYDEGEDK